MVRRIVLAAVCWVCLVESGCAPSDDAELLLVTRLLPDRVEPGSRVHIAGRGFIPGRTATVAWQGALYRPGREALAVSHAHEVHVGAFEELSFRIDDAFLDAIGGRGTFEGEVRVSMRGAHGGSVQGRLRDVSLDLLPATERHLHDEVVRTRAGNALLRRIGVGVRETSVAPQGVTVERLDARGIAALAGIAAGDRIIAANRVRVNGVSDIVPQPGAPRVTLDVARANRADMLHIDVPVHASMPVPLENGPLGAPAILVLLGGLFVLRPSMRWAFPALPPPRAQPQTNDDHLPLQTVVSMSIVFACSLLVVLLAAGSLQLSGIVAAQGPWPWEWLALRHPALLTMFVLYVYAALTAAQGARSSLVRAALLICAAILAATLFLGGWNVSGAEGLAHERVARGLSTVVLVGKVVVAFAVFWRLQRAPLPRLRAWHAVGAIVAVLVTMALVSVRIPVDAERTIATLTTAWVAVHVALRCVHSSGNAFRKRCS